MNKKYNNLLICLLILFFLLEIFNHSSIIINTIYQSSYIWFYNIVPTLFPIYIITDLLANYNGFYYLSKLFGKFMEKVFKMKKETSFIFLLSIISGFPSNSKYIKMMLDNKTINIKEANKLLTFTHFSNPLFIIESIGINFLHNKKIGLLILVIHYITNIIIGFFYRNYYVNLDSIIILKKDKESFVNCLTNSIYKTIKILLLLFGIITFFMLITSILKTNLKINSFILNIICGLLEMTQGIYYIASSNINIILKASIITFFLSFGGISIHMQVFSILKDYNLKYSNYLLARIFHGLISFSLVYLVLSI